ncbi:alpha-2-macroglobulin [Duganella dendranthematis]|uniref:Alpha-2-macroglobulin n=1 Tax=Duganella dendranthematis TaxID=2728021 RepID=A0ABX6M436_9BURK|nr:MG2 domain-containing protein [Duganella dendranthematis]QJD89069.1 alpha-2-macroglobulin [Duganella dendranthematis]
MRLLSRIIALAALSSLPLAVLADTSVTSFSPSGTVKGVRQVAARFSGQMVPLGDMRLSDPFTVDCPQEGKGRWIDGQNWSYDFVRDLPGGVACRFTLKDDVKDIDGKPLKGDRQFSFDTGGPAVVEAAPRDGSGAIDEQQIFVLGLDAPASESTITAHAWCQAEGINEKIGVRLLQGAERQRVLEMRKSFTERYLSLYFKARGVVWRATAKVNNQKLDKLPIVVLQCQRPLPADANVSLVWGAGIAADSGLVTTQEQKLAFNTRPDFNARFSCDRLAADGACIPFLPMRVQFSAPVPRADALAVKITGPSGKVFKPVLTKEEEQAEYLQWLNIKGPFPESARLTLSMPPKLKDDAGRMLVNQASFPMTVRTDAQPPLVKFPARFGIIEAKGDKLLPVTVRNVEARLAGSKVDGAALRVNDGAASSDQQDQQVIAWLKRMGTSYSWQPQEQWGDSLGKQLLDAKAGKVERFAMPKPSGGRAMEVVGVPLRKPGFYVVELASPKLGEGLGVGKKAYVSAAALVTNMVAHFKHGAESSVVWVTSLDKGQPVPQAQVVVRDFEGNLLWQGMTDAGGLAHIRKELPTSRKAKDGRYFVSARLGADMTFTLSDWDRGIETWRFNLPGGDGGADNVIATTVFDRMLLRAGETVHMKHFLRRHVEQGIVQASKEQDRMLHIMHEGSQQQYDVQIKWNPSGSAESTWTIPADAKQGWYQLMLSGRTAGRFRVEQFRVPTMKALLQGPKTPAIQASSVALDIQLGYLSGGGAGDAPVQLRTVVQDKGVSFADYPDFSFSNGDVKVGAEKNAGTFDDDEGMYEGDGEGEDGAVAGPANIKTRNLTLDKAGGARVTLDQLPEVQTPKELMAEMTFQDANGETLSAATQIALWPSSYVIGIQPDGWVASKEGLKFTVAVLDLQGKPVPDAPVAVDFFQRLSYSHRRRLIGGFYAYENSSEIKALGAACEGRTDNKGLLICKVKAPASGNLILRAKTQDGQQRAAIAHRETWVADGADWWFAATDNDRIDLLPEKKRYEPGETASFQVRMPFREATALVTVEREGVIDTYIRPLSGSEPVFTIPVKKSYAPNVYVSALVVRGRVNSVQPTALVDLGKPAYKLGIAPLRVGWSANELKVQVTADKPVYKVRDKATVAVKVTLPDGSAPPAGAEVALAAVDVGLLELMPNTSWDLLETMMGQRSLQVTTATAQMQVVGKRHFGRKAVPAGGGGGKGAGRELFDTLLFWKARVTLDANGEATVQVPINDSLTAFRIVAVASAQADLFGTGRTEVRSSQDLILLSGLPALVREGDRLRAGFTLRNTTDAAVKATLTASAGGKALSPQSVSLEPGQAREIGWDVQVPAGASTLDWDVSAAVEGGGAGSTDRIKIKQKVVLAVPVTVMQATLLQLDRKQSMQVALPDDAVPGRGGVQVQYSPSLGGDLPGVQEYMKKYPYRCFEQVTSRSIALHDKSMWQSAIDTLPAHLDSDGLVKYFATMQQGSDTLTAYVLSAAAEAGYVIPDGLRGQMESGLLAFVQGKVVRYSALPTADLAVRKIAALEALSRSRPTQAADLESFTLQPNLWPTSAVLDWYQILQRSKELPQRVQRLKEAEQILRSRLNLQGTTMTFSTERTDDWWWLMSSADGNANRLLLVMADNPAWKDDIGRLARGALGRQQKGRWGTTVANAWGVLAVDKFSRLFEKDKVTGTAGATLANASKSIAFGGEPAGGTVMLPWPRGGSGQLALEHAGAGKPWATVQTLSAVPLKAPLSSGYRIAKTITPVEQKVKGVWSRGDVYRVHLDLEAQSDMTWVVVDDPIPASATVLGSGLGGDSKIMRSGEASTGWAYPAFQERTFEGYRAFYEFVPKGKWSVEYTVRLNNPGQFNLPPTRVEAMYSPEMFGASPNAAITVK